MSATKMYKTKTYQTTQIAIRSLKITSKVDVDPRSFEFIHDKPPLPRQSK